MFSVWGPPDTTDSRRQIGPASQQRADTGAVYRRYVNGPCANVSIAVKPDSVSVRRYFTASRMLRKRSEHPRIRAIFIRHVSIIADPVEQSVIRKQGGARDFRISQAPGITSWYGKRPHRPSRCKRSSGEYQQRRLIARNATDFNVHQGC